MVARLFFLFLSVSFNSQASLLKPYLVSAKQYQNGASLCAPQSEITVGEEGHFLQVPLDYSNSKRGMTPIYYHFAHAYDPQKPTLIFFDGGPGDSSHSGSLTFDLNFNVVFFDQRGVACSRPQLYSTYRDISFYSSENTARDAEALRKHLGLAQWSVFGVSYGTVPATIYGHLFPANTTAVVLEGVVFSGQDQLWSAPHRRKILQRLLNLLPSEDQQLFLNFATKNYLPLEWFSLLARSTLIQSDGVASLRDTLMHLAGPAGDELVGRIQGALQEQGIGGDSPIFESDMTVYGIISCKELALLHPGASPLDTLEGLELVPTRNDVASDYCAPLGVTQESLYQSTNYPLQVPVTYFQGGDDSATEAPLAINHYKKAALGQAQLLILPRGGHNPNLELIYSGSLLELQIFETALKGNLVPISVLQQLKMKENHFWAFTSK